MNDRRIGARLRAWLQGPGWVGYLWLLYLVFLPLDPYLSHAPASVWAWTWASLAVFLGLYLTGFAVEGRTRLAIVAALGFLDAALLPINPGAMAYGIYGAAFIGHAGLGRRAYRVLAVYVLALTVYTAAWHVWPGVLIETVGFTSLIGVLNILYGELRDKTRALEAARGEIERLAAAAERERIARDLHDVLGHTLSVIVLKSELAARVADHDPVRAAGEIKAVESIARDALAEVRSAVAGYRGAGIAAELHHAREVLASAGVAVECVADAAVRLPPEQEQAATLTIREAVTNVVRHAHAANCRLAVARTDDLVRVEIADDGVGASAPEGSGLRGMRERAEALGGRLVKRVEHGTRLVLELPVAGPA